MISRFKQKIAQHLLVEGVLNKRTTWTKWGLLWGANPNTNIAYHKTYGLNNQRLLFTSASQHDYLTTQLLLQYGASVWERLPCQDISQNAVCQAFLAKDWKMVRLFYLYDHHLPDIFLKKFGDVEFEQVIQTHLPPSTVSTSRYPLYPQKFETLNDFYQALTQHWEKQVLNRKIPQGSIIALSKKRL